MEEDVPIESKLITKRIAKAQEAVEMQNFEARKHLLEYDDVNNKQRQAVYGMRRQLLEGIDQKERIMEMVGASSSSPSICAAREDKHPDTWDLSSLRNDILSQFGARVDIARVRRMTRQEIIDLIFQRLQQKYQEKEDLVGPDMMRQTERIVMLQVIDNQWKDHLLSMDELKQGIGNQAMARRIRWSNTRRRPTTCSGDDGPDRGRDRAVPVLPAGEDRRPPVCPFPEEEEEEDDEESARPEPPNSSGWRPKTPWRTSLATSSARRRRSWRSCSSWGDGSDTTKQVVGGNKVGRNDPCPCGSGKKYKKCHGA